MDFDVRDLKREKKMFKLEQFEHFETILQNCIVEIKHEAKYNMKEHCNFIVPTCKIGNPIYRIEDLESYLIKQLTVRGFFVVKERERVLYISWKDKDLEYVKQQRLMEERREQLESNSQEFNEFYTEHERKSKQIDRMVSDINKIHAVGIPQMKNEEICLTKNQRQKAKKNELPIASTKQRKQKIKQHATTPAPKKNINEKEDVISLQIMYKDGIKDFVPLSQSYYNHLLKYQQELFE